ncbi:MAG: tripartite tricarboxylate transporter substrate binding protein [Betaproteobacteria bacterium]|nr:tripartite tricarboxylate transporter substrate binding protein [Betaproteobacteria bacterium]
MICRRAFLAATAALAIVPALAGAQGRADDYPSKPVTMVVVFPSGQAGDVLARILGEALTKIWGQSLIVDNKAGAAGAIGSAYVARAKADGYTLLLGSTGPMAVAPHFNKNIGYDPRKDFSPIMTVAGVGYTLVVPANSRFKTLQDMIAAAKFAPGKLNYASAGTGSTQHLMMEMLKQRAGIDLLHVPYKGLQPAYIDLFGGSLDAFFDTQPGVMPFLQAGKIRVLAVSTAQRVATLPDVPTVAESGFPGFDVLGWYGLVAPRGLDPAIGNKLNADLKKALATESVKGSLSKLGMFAIGSSPDDLGRFIDSEMNKFGAVIKTGNISVE